MISTESSKYQVQVKVCEAARTYVAQVPPGRTGAIRLKATRRARVSGSYVITTWLQSIHTQLSFYLKTATRLQITMRVKTALMSMRPTRVPYPMRK